MMGKKIVRVSFVLGTLALASCANVQPWQRGDLAKPGMAFESDQLLTTYRQHVAVSKEAASGDTNLGGGGCGCN